MGDQQERQNCAGTDTVFPAPVSGVSVRARQWGMARSGPCLSTAAAVLLGALCAPPILLAAESLDIRIEAGFTTDDNVTRARGADRLSDQSYSLNLSKSLDIPVSQHTRLLLLGFLGGEKFRAYTGLSRYFYGIQGEFQYRASGEFGSPIFGAFVRGSKDQYESDLRDGYRYSAGLTVRKPVTDRIHLFGNLAYNVRDGKSTVFDTKDWSTRLNLDYALTRSGSVYLGGEYRRGDVVSTAIPSLAYVAEASVQDDAYTDIVRQAYRLKAGTALATIGYNLAFGEGQALDVSWRWAQSTSTSTPGNTIRYFDNQFTVAYLIRF
jgi:hypothetical protein